MENAVIQTVKNVLPLVRKSTIHFSKSDLTKSTKEVTSVISTNKLPLFRIPLEQNSDKKKVQVAALKDDCAIFSRRYIACQSREGNPNEFFKHKNHLCIAQNAIVFRDMYLQFSGQQNNLHV